MTQVIFDVVDLVGEVHPGDTVSVWPPYVTSTADGRVRSTRKIDVLVDEGPVTEDIEPGPIVVQLQCRGISDTKPRTVTIPDEGTITLANLLQSTFTYTPAVVSQVSLEAQRAEDAAVRAEAGAATVGDAQAVLDARDDTVVAVATLGDAQTVLGARDQAVQSAEDASSAASSAADSASSAAGSASTATGAASAAAGSASAAASSASAAEAAAVRAEAGVATGARTPRILVHTGTGDPVLADFPDAQVGDLIERASDSRRWNVGDETLTPTTPTDTGWRRLDSSYLLNGWEFEAVQYLLIRRQGDLVYLQIPGISLNGSEATSNIFMLMPTGFVADTGGNYGALGYIAAENGSGPVEVGKDFSHLTVGPSSSAGSIGGVSGLVIFRTTQTMPPSAAWPGIPDS